MNFNGLNFFTLLALVIIGKLLQLADRLGSLFRRVIR